MIAINLYCIVLHCIDNQNIDQLSDKLVDG